MKKENKGLTLELSVTQIKNMSRTPKSVDMRVKEGGFVRVLPFAAAVIISTLLKTGSKAKQVEELIDILNGKGDSINIPTAFFINNIIDGERGKGVWLFSSRNNC